MMLSMLNVEAYINVDDGSNAPFDIGHKNDMHPIFPRIPKKSKMTHIHQTKKYTNKHLS